MEADDDQWEKAARGTDGRIYLWGNDTTDTTKLNFSATINDAAPVGNYPTGASPYGVMDMAGNAWECVNDRYSADYYVNSPTKNPQGPEVGAIRVLRGGSWFNNSDFVRTTFRQRLGDTSWLDGGGESGSRCARFP